MSVWLRHPPSPSRPSLSASTFFACAFLPQCRSLAALPPDAAKRRQLAAFQRGLDAFAAYPKDMPIEMRLARAGVVCCSTYAARVKWFGVRTLLFAQAPPSPSPPFPITSSPQLHLRSFSPSLVLRGADSNNKNKRK